MQGPKLTFFRRKLFSFESPFPVLIGLIALSIAKGLLGQGPIRAYTHDSWIFLDGAWRILNGQRPHQDFYSSLGVLCYLPTVLGLKFSHGISAVNWGQCFCGIIVTLMSVPLAFNRLRSPFSVLYCTSLTVLAIAPFSMGDFFTIGSQAVFYNRVGYALLGILLVECVCPVRSGRRSRSEFWGGLIAGSIVGTALFLKFTFAAFAVVLILATISVRTQSRARWLGLMPAALITAIAGLAFLHFDVAAIRHDLHILSMARSPGLLYILGKPLQNIPRLAGICAYVAVAMLAFRHAGETAAARRWSWVFLVTLGVDILALGTNSFRQVADFPFTALAILVMLGDVEMVVLPSGSLRTALLVWGLSIALVNPLLDAAGLASATARIAIPRARFPTAGIDSPVGDNLITTGLLDPEMGTKPGIDEINDGLALLRQHAGPQEKIGALWFANPFPYWLQRPPMRGSSTCYDYGGSFTEKSGPIPQEAFGAADIIIVPRSSDDASTLGRPNQPPLLRIYGPYVEAHFTRMAESRFWWLYRKNALNPPS